MKRYCDGRYSVLQGNGILCLVVATEQWVYTADALVSVTLHPQLPVWVATATPTIVSWPLITKQVKQMEAASSTTGILSEHGEKITKIIA